MTGLVRVTVVLLGSLGLLAMSAFPAVSGQRRFTSPFEGKPTATYCSWGSLSAGSPGTSPASNTTNDVYASSADPDTGDPGSGDAVPPGYSRDAAQSTALTGYLQKNRLPLVRALVFTNGGGDRQVLLYGFVATDRGKENAAARARQYLSDPSVEVINRIAVRPELLTSGGGGSSSSPAPGSDAYDGELGSAQSYQEQAEEAQRQQQAIQKQQELDAVLLLMRLLIGLL